MVQVTQVPKVTQAIQAVTETAEPEVMAEKVAGRRLATARSVLTVALEIQQVEPMLVATAAMVVVYLIFLMEPAPSAGLAVRADLAKQEMQVQQEMQAILVLTETVLRGGIRVLMEMRVLMATQAQQVTLDLVLQEETRALMEMRVLMAT